MKNLFFPGMQEIGERILHSPHLLVAVDYDGTLTEIVDNPTQAFLAPPMRQLLSDLAERGDVDVAVISGRALADLQKMADIPGAIYAGNHGMEISGPGIRFIEPAAQTATRSLLQIALDLAAKLRSIPGVIVEDKGLTISVHYRKVVPVDVEEVWHSVLHAVEPVGDRFHVTHGAKVYEIRPLVRWDKGAAITWIQDQLRRADSVAIYIGDDATDEDAFVALRDRAVTIKVGDSVATTAARYLLPSPMEVFGFLTWIHEVLQEKTGHAASI